MRRDGGSRGGRCACASRSRDGSRARRLHAVRGGSLAAPGWDVSLADDVTAAPACHRHYCRPTFGRIDRRTRLALLGRALGRLESRHRLLNRRGATVAQVVISAVKRAYPARPRCEQGGNAQHYYYYKLGELVHIRLFFEMCIRDRAKETLDIEQYKKSMEGIYTTSVNNSTLDEAPMA